MGLETGEKGRGDDSPHLLPIDSPESNPSPLDSVRRRKWVLLACVAAGLAVGLVQASKGVPLYQAESKVLLMSRGAYTSLRGTSGGAGAFPHDVLRTHMEIIKSPVIASKAIASGKLLGLPGIAGDKEGAVDQLVQGLQTSRDPASRILRVGYLSPDANTSAAVVNTVVEAYRQFVEETQRDTTAQTLRILVEQKEKVERRLRELDQQLVAMQRRSGSPVIAGKDGQPAMIDRLSAVRDMLVQARLKELQAKARYETVKRAAEGDDSVDPNTLAMALRAEQWGGDTTQADAYGDSQLRAARVKGLRMEIARLSKELGPRHPRIQQLNDELVLLGAKPSGAPAARFGATDRGHGGAAPAAVSGSQLKRLVCSLEQQYKMCGEVRERIEKDYEAQRAKSLDLSAEQTAMQMAIGERQRLQKRLKALADQSEALDLSTEVGSLAIRVLARAKAPGAPISAGGMRMIVMAVVLGVVVGLGLVGLLDRLDKSFRSPDDVKVALQLPVLGNIPSFSEDAECEGSLPIVVFAKPRSIEAEAFRALRTVLSYTAQRQGMNTLLITSPNPNDGKTTLVSNLATAMAGLGARVLVIDADLRHRQMHSVFHCRNRGGLTEYLTGDDPSWHGYVHGTAVPNVHVIPAGRQPENPAELLSSPRFQHLLGQVRRAYDYVLIDSAPVLSVTDATVVASQADATLLVVKIDKNEKPTAVAAKEALEAVDAQIMGVVINDVNSGSRYGYAYYNRYYHRYGRGYYYYGRRGDDNQAASA